MKLKMLLRWFAGILLIALVMCVTRSARALPGFAPPGEGFVTTGNLGPSACNGCHGPATAPSTVSMQVNGGGFLSIAGVTRNFAVPKNNTNHFQLHVTPPAGQPGAGFLVFHTDASTNDNGGLLHAFDGAQHTCKSPGTDPPAFGCAPTTNNNTEVMHAGGAVNGGGGTITLDFQYDSLNACATHSFRIWVNSVNANGACDGPGDAAAPFDFTVSTTGACNDGNNCTTGEACQTNGTCGGGAGVTCTPSDVCHSVGACVAPGGCPAETVNVGLPCNDFNQCTNGTTCQAGSGACAGGTPVTCATPDTCHSQGACVPASGCPAPTPLTGNPCDDGHACTNPDACQAGTCTGPGLSCPAPNECQTGGGCDDVSLGCLPLVNKAGGTLCGAVSFCSAGNVFHPHQTCTTGACGSPATTNCNGTCDPVTGCGGCNTDTDCLAGNYCDNTGTCTPFKAAGTCNLASGAGGGDCKAAGCHECSTNNCVDGFCCNSTCGGGSTTDCIACNVAATPGVCSPIAVGTGCNADSNLCTQNDACNAAGTCVAGATVVCAAPQACQAAGICNPATGTCNYALLNGTTCAPATCQADGITLLQTSLCTGAAPACPAQVPLNCFPNPCTAGACAVGCTLDTNCAAGAFCNGTACAAKKPIGGTCGTDHECQQGHCSDGVCCTAACTGQCEACNVPASVGTCLTVAGNPRGTRPQCMNDGAGCGGTCDGVAATGCIYPDSTKSCRAASCNAPTNVGTLPAGCNGAGACPALQTISCGNFVCGPTQCNGDCMGDDTKCTATSFCAAGICQPKKPNGGICGMPHECSSNFCTDGVCCSADCKSQCQACDVTGSSGTCTTVSSGPPHGGRLRCDGTGACQASCNGAAPDACGFPDATQLCGSPSCADGTEVQIATCNGNGACSTPIQKNCTPYACGVTSCRTACSSPLDCARGFDCIASLCVAPDATMPVEEASAPESGTDGSSPIVPDGSVIVVDAETPDVSSVDASTTPDAGVGTGPDAGAGSLPVAPEFEGGSCACRAAGTGAGQPPVSLLLPLLGLALAVTRRRTTNERRRSRV